MSWVKLMQSKVCLSWLSKAKVRVNAGIEQRGCCFGSYQKLGTCPGGAASAREQTDYVVHICALLAGDIQDDIGDHQSLCTAVMQKDACVLTDTTVCGCTCASFSS